MAGSSARRERRLEKKSGAGNVAVVGHRAGMSMAGAMAPLAGMKEQIEAFMVAAEQIREVAGKFEGVQQVAHQIDEAREIAARALEEFAGFEYELTKQRFVALRMHYHLMWGDYDTTATKTKEERVLELIELEDSFRVEYDVIQALVLLVTKEA